MNKGEYGYLNRYKKKHILYSLLIGVVMALVIGIGYWINKDIKNIYTVVGILFALPLARFLSVYFVTVPMKAMDESTHKELTEELSHAGSDQFLWDLALSSTEKVRHFPCVVWSDHHLVAWYEGKEKADVVQKYLTNILKNNCHRTVTAKVFTDKKSFLKAAKNTNFGVTSEQEWDRIKETILIYEM